MSLDLPGSGERLISSIDDARGGRGGRDTEPAKVEEAAKAKEVAAGAKDSSSFIAEIGGSSTPLVSYNMTTRMRYERGQQVKVLQEQDIEQDELHLHNAF
jgi:hypothetical protein